jgi:hypothetical protein
MVPRRKSAVEAPIPAAKPFSELTFCASRRKAFVVLLLALVFSVAGYSLIDRDPVVGWLGVIFGALGSLAASLFILFPRLSSLKLTADGFAINSLFSNDFTRWEDVTGFVVGSYNMNKMVFYNYAPHYTGKKLGRKIASDLSGWEGAIADMYGISPEELADLMNQWKERSSTPSRRE